MITYKGRQIPETLEEIVAPKHTALIIHEIFNDLCAKGGVFDKLGRRVEVEKILSPVLALLDAAREKGVKVIYVRYTNFPDYSNMNDPLALKYYDRILAKTVIPIDGTWGWENLAAVAPQEGEPIIKKLRVDCFEQTNLDMILRSNGIRTFVIVGLGAEVGIVPTVSTGQNLGYFCVAPEDCMGAVDPSKIDVAKRFIGRYASMPKASEILKVWEASN